MRLTPLFVVFLAFLTGCASITNDAFVPIAFSMSDGSSAKCKMTNKRGRWVVNVPDTPMIRRSDDALKYSCKTENGGEAEGAIPSTIGAKIVASAVFIDLGITDAITDKHREYPASFVIPVKAGEQTAQAPSSSKPSARGTPKEVQGAADAMLCSSDIKFVKTVGDKSHWLLSCEDGETLDLVCVEGTCYVR